MEQTLLDLEKENARLNELAQIDWLTGVYNRCTTERKINDLLAAHHSGLLFVLDGDQLKKINDRYGHTAGDCLLQKMAQVLRYMVLKQDIVGRIGGDEFVVYIPTAQSMEFALEKSQQFAKRVHEIRLDGAINVKISVTIGVSRYEPGDDYRSLFDRADQRLIAAKHQQQERGKKKGGVLSPKIAVGGIDIDMKLISEELAEQELIPGAFCQDYEMFKVIYRFVERRLRRTKSSSYLILLTLTDLNGDFPAFFEREKQIALLGQMIQNSLRLGDVFTQYSSCQFLVMVPDAAENEANKIATRICNLFLNSNMDNQHHLLLHHCYPMMPLTEPKRI